MKTSPPTINLRRLPAGHCYFSAPRAKKAIYLCYGHPYNACGDKLRASIIWLWCNNYVVNSDIMRALRKQQTAVLGYVWCTILLAAATALKWVRGGFRRITYERNQSVATTSSVMDEEQRKLLTEVVANEKVAFSEFAAYNSFVTERVTDEDYRSLRNVDPEEVMALNKKYLLERRIDLNMRKYRNLSETEVLRDLGILDG